MASTTIHNLNYKMSVDSQSFTKGIISSRSDLKSLQAVMGDPKPFANYEASLKKLDRLHKKGLLTDPQFATAINKVSTEYHGLTRKLTPAAKAMEGLQRAEARFSKSIMNYGKYAAAGAAVGGLAVGINSVKNSFNNIDATVKDAAKLGIAIDDLMRLRGVAEMAGDVGAESVDSAIEKLNKNIQELHKGTESAIELFERVGITAADLEGKDLGEAFLKVADGIMLIEGADKQLRITQELLGKGAGDMANMMKMGSTEIERMGRGVAAVNALDAEKIAKGKDAMEAIGRSMEQISQHIAVTIAPFLEGLALSMGPSDTLGTKTRDPNKAAGSRGSLDLLESLDSKSQIEMLSNFTRVAKTINPDFDFMKLKEQSPRASRLIEAAIASDHTKSNPVADAQVGQLFLSLLEEVKKMRVATENSTPQAMERREGLE